MRNRFQNLSQIHPLPRQELETMRAQLQQMLEQLGKLPPQQNEVRIARSNARGLIADLDHLLYGQQMPQPQVPQTSPQTPRPQGRPQRRQQAPRLPVPSRVPAPPRVVTNTYEVVIGPLPNQRFKLTLPPGETIQSLYAAAVLRGQVVDREFQAGALTLDGRAARPEEISGTIPPASAVATTQEDMLRLLLLHNCFALGPERSPAGGAYTGGGGGYMAGFDAESVGQNPERRVRFDQFRDAYLAQQSAGSPVRVALLPQPSTPTQPRPRRRRGG
jgi:hypothetical protein